jgi:hypothetical protein
MQPDISALEVSNALISSTKAKKNTVTQNENFGFS